MDSSQHEHQGNVQPSVWCQDRRKPYSLIALAGSTLLLGRQEANELDAVARLIRASKWQQGQLTKAPLSDLNAVRYQPDLDSATLEFGSTQSYFLTFGAPERRDEFIQRLRRHLGVSCTENIERQFNFSAVVRPVVTIIILLAIIFWGALFAISYEETGGFGRDNPLTTVFTGLGSIFISVGWVNILAIGTFGILLCGAELLYRVLNRPEAIRLVPCKVEVEPEFGGAKHLTIPRETIKAGPASGGMALPMHKRNLDQGPVPVTWAVANQTYTTVVGLSCGMLAIVNVQDQYANQAAADIECGRFNELGNATLLSVYSVTDTSVSDDGGSIWLACPELERGGFWLNFPHFSQVDRFSIELRKFQEFYKPT